MNKQYILQEAQAGDDFYQRMSWLIGTNTRTWRSILAVTGLVGGVASPIFGSLLTVTSWLAGSRVVSSYLNGLSWVFFVLTIPLLLLGAHCLDLLESKTSRLSPPSEPPRLKSVSRYASSYSTRGRNKYHLNRTGMLAALALIFLLSTSGYAQQTVFNVPTTDVLEAGKVYFELDISAKPVDPKFSSFVPRLVGGTGGNVEVGLNVTGNIQPGPDSTTMVPGVKWRIYNGRENGWAIAVGNNLFIPVRNKTYDAGTYSYTTIQKSFKTRTRIGFGGYFFSKNVVAPNANRAGGQFTFEQPLTKKLNINADWFTGKHANGYLTVGTAYKLTNKLTGVAAYSIGNQNVTGGNHFMYFEVGYNFN